MNYKTRTKVFAFSMILIFAVSGCSSESSKPDYKSSACDNFSNSINKFTDFNKHLSDVDIADLEFSLNLLTADIADWKRSGGDSTKTYQLMTKYSSFLMHYLEHRTTGSLIPLSDFLDKSASSLLALCGVDDVIFANKLVLETGCFEGDYIDLEVQELTGQKWSTILRVFDLIPISACGKESFGVHVEIPRGLGRPNGFDKTYRLIDHDAGYDFYTCPIPTSLSDTNVWVEVWKEPGVPKNCD